MLNNSISRILGRFLLICNMLFYSMKIVRYISYWPHIASMAKELSF